MSNLMRWVDVIGDESNVDRFWMVVIVPILSFIIVSITLEARF